MLLLENSFLEDGAHLGEGRQGEGGRKSRHKRERGKKKEERADDQTVTE